MSTHKQIDRICCGVLVFVLLLTILFMNAGKLGVQAVAYVMGYQSGLFDTSTVHTIDIEMEDWESFLENCTNEEYAACSLVIDQVACKNVAIRAKGNTSLTSVASYGNNRYSFKVEFDHYDEGNTYYGLDKLCLNNIIQDNTFMKDYVTYQMMSGFGVDAPLCSFAYITVNGEDFGLYLAVEGVEESFLERNYGNDYGELYKPDSMSMGGGRGNGAGFAPEDMDEFREMLENQEDERKALDGKALSDENEFQQINGNPSGESANSAEEAATDDDQILENEMSGDTLPQTEEIPQSDNEIVQNEAEENKIQAENEIPQENISGMRDGKMKGGPEGMSMGSEDVSLIYTDDEYDSYSNIFDSAKTEITDSDKDRLIASLKALNEGNDIENVVDVEEVIRYFVVHNFVCNFDSYTGSMIHNYYLYEKDGQFSMIPWDYNLAFGGFESGTDAQRLVNYPIDSPVSGGTVESRPMLAWIFASEEYTELYHQYFAEFVEQYFTSGELENMIDTVSEMIAPYVEKDPTKFCSYEEFQEGVSTLKSFCTLRAESIQGQLEGTISATESSKLFGAEEQQAGDSEVVEAANLSIEAMGTMGNGFGRGGGPGETAVETGDFTGGNVPKPEDFREGPRSVPEGFQREFRPISEDSRGDIISSDEGAASSIISSDEDASNDIELSDENAMERDVLSQHLEKAEPFSGELPDMRTMVRPDNQRNDIRYIWFLTGISVIVLFAGIVYVCKYKKYV